MSLNTSKGITYPQNTENTRIWELMQTLATTADSIIIGNVDVQVFTSSGTWTKPTGAILVIAQVQGGGGGSGGCPATGAGQGAASPGGGGGEYARGTYKAADLGATESVTVGAGGSTGSASPGAGGNGGTSSFGSVITALGGDGSQAGTASSSSSSSLAGSSGGSGGTGGDFRISGDDGPCSQTISGYPVKFNNGGGSFLGSMQRSSGISINQTAGSNGNSYGGGASGASNGPSQTAVAGASGADGVVIVTTYTA
ncbi:hypothetical protein [Streptomyces sp. NBC_00996]|uniref:glycine-rich domain-containing protein n=1 Tax=Streptomyces sp. NBC_00996 TaxID=2903710 RepID=UPI00386E2B22|nr:hypothetical protein OG390_17170 [Streptomyces sp. NBC_00996]